MRRLICAGWSEALLEISCRGLNEFYGISCGVMVSLDADVINCDGTQKGELCNKLCLFGPCLCPHELNCNQTNKAYLLRGPRMLRYSLIIKMSEWKRCDCPPPSPHCNLDVDMLTYDISLSAAILWNSFFNEMLKMADFINGIQSVLSFLPRHI